MGGNGRFEIERRRGGGVWLITVHGEHLSSVEPRLDQALAVVDGAPAVVVDLSLAVVGSLDVRALRQHAQTSPGRGDRLAVVAAPGTACRRLVDQSNVVGFMRVFDSTHDALSTCGERGWTRQVEPSNR